MVSARATDVLQTVEYRRDKWNMERVPVALLLCLGGLAFVAYVDPSPPSYGVLLLFAVLLVAGIIKALLGYLLDRIIDRLPAFLIGALLVLGLIALLAWGNPGRRPRLLESADGIPVSTIGWVLVLLGLCWIAFALYRRLIPAMPILLLSPGGIAYHTSWLKGLLIPWHEIQGVDSLEHTGASGFPQRHEDVTVVLVSMAFYEQCILPKRSFLSDHTWNLVFRPKGVSMQMVLHYGLFSIDPKHIRAPVEERWQAFRGAPASAPSVTGPGPDARQIYGVWSIDGSLWQAITFLVPLIAIAAILVVLGLRLR